MPAKLSQRRKVRTKVLTGHIYNVYETSSRQNKTDVGRHLITGAENVVKIAKNEKKISPKIPALAWLLAKERQIINSVSSHFAKFQLENI